MPDREVRGGPHLHIPVECMAEIFPKPANTRKPVEFWVLPKWKQAREGFFHGLL